MLIVCVRHSFGVNSLMAFEAFVGLLFGGVSAAIIFGKMARIQSIAQVRFSHSMCIRFGTAVLDSGGLVDETENGGVEHHGFPCPILEFRVINLLSSQKGGAILNASVRIVASVLDNDEESENVKSLLKVKPSRRTTLQAAKSARGSAMESIRSMTAIAGSRVANRTGGALFADKRTTQPTSGSLVQQLNRQLLWQPHDLDDMIDEAVPYSEQGETIPSHDAVETRHDQTNDTSGMESPKAFAAVDEGNALLAPPRVYHRLEVSRYIDSWQSVDKL
jgi:hypothetical protein